MKHSILLLTNAPNHLHLCTHPHNHVFRHQQAARALFCFFIIAFFGGSFGVIAQQTTEQQTAEQQNSAQQGKSTSYSVKKDVLVTGSRLPNDGRNPRHLVVVLDRASIERTPARSVEELLESVAGVDVRQRGPMGVQADISIRGGTFDQTLVLIDGIKQIDPQTGHHSMNIPLTLDDIERIEILKGPGSRQYGPNAFAGAINIITRKRREMTARIGAMGGTNGLYELSLSASAPVRVGENVIGNRFSVMRRRANGYPTTDSIGTLTDRLNTDFDIVTVSGAAELVSNDGVSLEASANFVEKKFAANGFYSTRFPLQYEETRTVFAALSATFGANDPFVARAYWRRNQDFFLLRRDNPDFYRNIHASNTFGAELQKNTSSTLGVTAFALEGSWDGLVSSNLGSHQRTRFNASVEHQWKPLDNLTVEAGVTAQYNSDWGINAAPGADIGWQITDNISLRASIGQSFRVPTYTDLYYRDAANIGDSTLVPERAWTYEIGGVLNIPMERGAAQINVTVFQRNAAPLIDFVKPRDSVQLPWRAKNISSLVMTGVDVHGSVSWQRTGAAIELDRAILSYTTLDPKFSAESASKYVLDHLIHHAVASADVVWFGALRNQWRARYEQRVGLTGNWFVDARLAWEWNDLEIYAEATNLLNNTPRDLDILGLPTAGRWLRIGAAYNFASLWK